MSRGDTPDCHRTVTNHHKQDEISSVNRFGTSKVT